MDSSIETLITKEGLKMSQTTIVFNTPTPNKQNDASVKISSQLDPGDSGIKKNPITTLRNINNISNSPPHYRADILSAINPNTLRVDREHDAINEGQVEKEVKKNLDHQDYTMNLNEKLSKGDNPESGPTIIEPDLKNSSKKSGLEEEKVTIPQGISLNDQELRIPYVRVGCTYYKIIFKKDRYGIPRREYKPWKKDEIRQDFGKEYLKSIPHYDEFTILPNNLERQSVIGNCINLYSEFTHKPKAGDWIWTERLLKHVFCEQYELGLRYMQILYLHPDRATIILVLVSKERGTGKTTFINWLNMIFGPNMVVLSNTDFSSSFNTYCTKNIIGVEETFLEKKAAVEKLKALATAKQVQVNEKFISPYMIPFFGKIILTSNNEDRFVQIDEAEIRYFVRKLGKPEFTNHNIEEDLQREIPAFLYHLQGLPSVDWTVSRSGFTPEELYNECLQAVVDESKSGLAKDLKIQITEYFDNNDQEVFLASPTDIKIRFFSSISKYSPHYIGTVLKNEFGLSPTKNSIRYTPIDELHSSKTGRPFEFRKEDYVTALDVTNSET